MLSVSDVYCLYNRARGMELVSPDDVVTACQMFTSLSLPLRYNTYIIMVYKCLQVKNI